MKFTLPPKGKKRIDLLIDPIKTGDWQQEIKWKYYDDFKMNPSNYPDVFSFITFNPQFDNNSCNFVKS